MKWQGANASAPTPRLLLSLCAERLPFRLVFLVVGILFLVIWLDRLPIRTTRLHLWWRRRLRRRWFRRSNRRTRFGWLCRRGRLHRLHCRRGGARLDRALRRRLHRRRRRRRSLRRGGPCLDGALRRRRRRRLRRYRLRAVLVLTRLVGPSALFRRLESVAAARRGGAAGSTARCGGGVGAGCGVTVARCSGPLPGWSGLPRCPAAVESVQTARPARRGLWLDRALRRRRRHATGCALFRSLAGLLRLRVVPVVVDRCGRDLRRRGDLWLDRVAAAEAAALWVARAVPVLCRAARLTALFWWLHSRCGRRG